MPLSDYTSDIEALIASGKSKKDAITEVAANNGLSRNALQTAYYRDPRRVGAGRSPRGRKRVIRAQPVARTEPAPGAAALAATRTSSNGKASIEELLIRLKLNAAENEQIMTQLEALVAEHTQRLAEVRAALTA